MIRTPDFEASLAEPDYSFDLVGVWVEPEGFYLATDSGCSCPTPWENYHEKEDLTGPLTHEQMVDEALNLAIMASYPNYALEHVMDMLRDLDGD